MSEEVAQVLLDIGLGQHVGALIYQEHVFDLEKLKLLDEDKMKDIGMPFEDQRKIRLWIRACETFDIVSNKEGELDLKRLQIAFASLDLGQSETATRAMLRQADISESNLVDFSEFINLVMKRYEARTHLSLVTTEPPKPSVENSGLSSTESEETSTESEDEMYWLPDADDIWNADILTSEDAIDAVAIYADDDEFGDVPALVDCDGESCKAAFLYIVVNADLLQEISKTIVEAVLDSFKTDLNNVLEDNDFNQMEEVANEEQIRALATVAYETFVIMAHRYSHRHPLIGRPNESSASEMNRFRVLAVYWSNKQVTLAYAAVFLEALREHLERQRGSRGGGFWLKLLLMVGGGFLLAVLGVDPTVLMASVPDGVVEVVTSDAMQETMQDFIARVSGG